MTKHKHYPKSESETGWGGCVTPHQCMTTPARCDAHGGITRTQVCRCGAERKIESNCWDQNASMWAVADSAETD